MLKKRRQELVEQSNKEEASKERMLSQKPRG